MAHSTDGRRDTTTDMVRPGISRRDFVAAGATAAAALPTASPVASDRVLTPEQVADIRRLAAKVPFHFDLGAFNAILRRPFEHRQVFAATGTWEGGSEALSHMQRSLDSYADVQGFNAGDNSLHAACVFFEGDSALIALDDEMYAKYPIFVIAEQRMHPENPVYAQRARSIHTNPEGSQYRQLAMKYGASFFVCNNALSGLAYDVARAVTQPATAVTREFVVQIHDEMVRHFLPGTILVPTGVAAMNAIQEQRFTLLPG
jgi:hypothetical protein